MKPRFQNLVEELRQKFGVEAEWLRSEHVRDEWQGRTVWEGDVQIFAIKGHPRAELAYAWSYQTKYGRSRAAAVLSEGPVMSAGDAVRNFVVTDSDQTDQQHRN